MDAEERQRRVGSLAQQMLSEAIAVDHATAMEIAENTVEEAEREQADDS